VLGKDSLTSEGKRQNQVIQRQSLTTSCERTDAQPVSEQQLLWEDCAAQFPLLSMTLCGMA